MGVAIIAKSYLLLFALGDVVRESLHDFKRHFGALLWEWSWIDECWSENGDVCFELLVQPFYNVKLLGVLLINWQQNVWRQSRRSSVWWSGEDHFQKQI